MFMFRDTHNERCTQCIHVWTVVDYAHLQVSIPRPGNNGYRDMSPYSLQI
jgi:hypothetical protein